MSFFVQYVIKRRRYLLLLGTFAAIYAVTFALYRLPLAAVWYPTALSL